MPVGDSTRYHVVLNSGGPDSLITYFALCRAFPGDIVASVYFDLGHRYALEEKLAAAMTVPDTLMLEPLRGLGEWEEEDAHIHLRNVFLILAATKLFNENTTIYLSVQKDEMDIPDRKPLTLASINSLLTVLGIDASVKSLWNHKDKTDMVKQYVEMGGCKKKLYSTWSCYNPTRMYSNRRVVHCGDCPACIRRHIAFVLGSGEDRTLYKNDPEKSDTAEKYEYRAKCGVYSEDRCKRILSVIK